MIPVLIVCLLKKIKVASILLKFILVIKSKLLKFKILAVLLSTAYSYGSDASSLSQVTYNVVKNNKVIGSIHISREVIADSVSYVLTTNIKTKHIVNVNIIGKETSIFKNGILVYSSIYRSFNNKTKESYSIVYRDGSYHLMKMNKDKLLDFDLIRKNLVTLFFGEPKFINEVFCDNKKETIALQTIGKGKYKIAFSKFKFNIFHYQNGRCIKIEAKSPLFNVTLIQV